MIAVASVSTRSLIWITADQYPYAHLYWSEILAGRVTPQDTVTLTTTDDTEYSGAASLSRRWVARSEFPDPRVPRRLVRVLYSDTVGTWTELPSQGVDEDHCAIAPLADHSALLAYAGQSGLSWARLEDTTWAARGNLDPRAFGAAHPRFRFRPSGGLWLVWTKGIWTHISSFRDGAWVRGDSLRAVHPPGETFSAAWCDASRDTAERPVVAWSDLGVGYTYRDVVCVAFPTDSGWAHGEEVPGSADGFDPTVTRDRNGDAWVAWWPLRTGGVFFTHTHVSVTTTAPRFDGSARRPLVSWTLSESAPDTWWAVLRATDVGEFESTARLRAGPGLEMSWTDSTAPAGVPLRYRIRRECVDRRYEWSSEEATWWPRGASLGLSLRGTNPSRSQIELALVGAEAGRLDVQLYDLQGRSVLRRNAEAGGSGQDSIHLDLDATSNSVQAGIYFAKVADSSGRASPALKLVILK